MTIDEFILARLAEREVAASRPSELPSPYDEVIRQMNLDNIAMARTHVLQAAKVMRDHPVLAELGHSLLLRKLTDEDTRHPEFDVSWLR